MIDDKSKPTLECLNDTATGEDSLGFKPYVEAIAEFLTADGTRPPITLSIEGRWGCGKSSFMTQLKEKIEMENISEIKIVTFLKYLFSKSEDKIPDELGSLTSFLEFVYEKSGNKKPLNRCSLKNKIRATLKYISSKLKRRKYFTVWFNCWRYEKEDELWAAFALNFVEELSKKLPWYYKIISQLRLIWRRYCIKFSYTPVILVYLLLKTISFIIIFLFLFLVISYILKLLGISQSNGLSITLLSPEDIAGFSGIITLLTSVIVVTNHFFSKEPFTTLLTDPFGLKKLESNTNYKERLPFREHFYSDFNEIIKSYIGNSKVYVFIDDLDRAEVPKAAELMQAINLMISEDSKVYFSIGMDRKIISAGLAAKNEKVIDYLGIEGIEYGYDFIEKFIQLPFKVPSPKSAYFLKFLMSPDEAENKTPLNPSEPVSKSSISEDFAPDKSPERNIKSLKNESNGRETGSDDSNSVETTPDKQEILNEKDCKEDYETSKLILEMVSPALDNNPRRIKQFINQFRFQRTIGKRMGLFSYKEGAAPENIWNCKKLAKFVAISIKWNSLISTLNSNRALLARLQEYALKPENEDKNLEKWIGDERLIGLLRYGCIGGGNLSQNAAEYTLSGLDFSKLLEISPETTSSDSLRYVIKEMEFISISAGEFMMGSPDYSVGINDNEVPVHKVTIKNPFNLGKYPVTQKQWIAVMGNNPSYFKGDKRPVENISWNEVQEFIKKLNDMEGTDMYRLPSEAEWEYACRAGTKTGFSFGEDKSKLGDYAWYRDNAGGETHPVGQKKPNLWDLYDMNGNVWEWVQDKWHDNYNGALSNGNAWEDEVGPSRVFRGGGWSSRAEDCRFADRRGHDPMNRRNDLGFRLLRRL